MTTHAPHTPRHKKGRARSATNGDHPLAAKWLRMRFNAAMRAKGIPAKACSRCRVIKDLEAFSAYRSASDGLSSYCRICKAAAHAEKMATDPNYVARRRAAAIAYNVANTAARRAYRVQRDIVVRAANRAKHADRVQDPAVLKICVGRCQRLLPETAFRLDRGNSDGLRERCRDCAARVARRLCEDAYGEPKGQTCYLCGEAIASSTDAHADHLIPQSQGGEDTASNLRWTHGACNVRRGASPITPEQWQRMRLLDSSKETSQ
ncbi:HNH endonuclease [Streptomyces nigrescens]